jgi:hypothetical protein
MKKYLSVLFLLLLLNFCHQAISDEVKDKTDGSFVGDGSVKPINSSFVGSDVPDSVVNDSFSGQDTHQQTDNTFVGTNVIKDDHSLFAGREFDQDVKEGTDAPFAGDKPVDTGSYDQKDPP